MANIRIRQLDNCDFSSNKKIETESVATAHAAILEPTAFSDRARELNSIAKENSQQYDCLEESRSSLKNEELLQKMYISMWYILFMYLLFIQSQHQHQQKVQQHQNSASGIYSPGYLHAQLLLKCLIFTRVQKG